MAKARYYIVDGINQEKALALKKSLEVVSGIKKVKVSVAQSMVEVHARIDPVDQVKLACDVAGVIFRTEAKKDW